MNEGPSLQVKIEPVMKQLKVNLSVESAFELFTERIGQWWPLATHSVGQEKAKDCFFEGWMGGRIVEVMDDSSQIEWGRVTAWEPPMRVAFHWYPGRGPDTAQQVVVTFKEENGGTRVELVHSGWEKLGDRAQTMRENYVTGWDLVLGKFASLAEKS